jgi:peptidoglycan/LPS O-acetylase OafA/YrhL
VTGVSDRYVPGIDALRALAVACVVAFHVRPGLLPGGFCGVDVFFVISGYVVSASLERRTTSRVGAYLSGFYARRIARIQPALVVALVGVAILQTLFVPASWLSDTAERTATLAFFGASNVALVWLDDGYFAPRAEFNAFTHTWSLAVEEQFYLVFPLLFRAWSRRRAHRWLVVPALASLAFAAHLTTAAPAHAFYLLPSRFWELAAGSLLFALHSEGRCVVRSPAVRRACCVGGLVSIAVAAGTADPHAFPFPWALVAVAGALLAIAATVGASVRMPAALLYLGKASYSVYLWHWPIFVLFRWTVGLERPIDVAAALALTAVASVASYEGVEKPARRLAAVAALPAWRFAAAGALVSVVAAWMVSTVIFADQPRLSLSVTRDRRTWYPEPWPADAVPATATSFAGRTIFVVGDSHAWAYGTMLRQLADERGAGFRQYAETGCTVADLLQPLRPGCDAFVRRTVATIVRDAAAGDVVFLAALRMNRLGDQWTTFDAAAVAGRQRSADAAAERARALGEADELVGELERANLTVMIDAPLPVFQSPPFRCADWFNVANPVCAGGLTIARAFLVDHRAPVMRSLDALATTHPKLVVWDPFPFLCATETCAAFDAAGPLFFDGDHLSAHGNRVLYPGFATALTAVWERE